MTGRIDFAQVEIPRLAADLAAGRTERLDALHVAAGLPPPMMVWRPERPQLGRQPLEQLHDHWVAGGGLNGGPGLVDPFNLRALLGYVMLMDPLPGDDGRGPDFRYRLYGSRIVDYSKIDLTGCRLSEVAVHKMPMLLFRVQYQALLLRPEPLLSEHVPPPEVAIATWRRLILPISDGAGGVSRLLVGNVPGEWRPPRTDAP